MIRSKIVLPVVASVFLVLPSLAAQELPATNANVDTNTGTRSGTATGTDTNTNTNTNTNTKQLSEILGMVENRQDFDRFDEVDWDDDGYWEVEYRTATGAEMKLKIDPATGDVRRAKED